MRRLKQSEVPMVRDKLAAKQNFLCPLCSGPLKQKGAVLDHDHDSGAVRAALCRNCNGQEGKVRTAATRCATREGMIDWLENLAKYWRYYHDNPRPFLYPTHKTDEEKRAARNKKARDARAAAKGKV